MPIAYVQHGVRVTPNTQPATVDGTSDVTWAAPTAGNTLIAHGTTTLTPGTLSMPAGWVPIYPVVTMDGGTTREGWWMKIADGTETSISLGSTDNDNLTLTVIEYSGLGDSPSVEVLGALTQTDADGEITLATATINVTAGETLLLAGVAYSNGLPGATNTWANSFTLINPNQRARAAYRIVTPVAATNYDTSNTWQTARRAMATILAIKPGTATGGSAALTAAWGRIPI